jgi:hypothetical protein
MTKPIIIEVISCIKTRILFYSSAFKDLVYLNHPLSGNQDIILCIGCQKIWTKFSLSATKQGIFLNSAAKKLDIILFIGPQQS